MPPVNRTTVLAGLAGLLVVAWLSGLVRVRAEDGAIRVTSGLLPKRSLELDFRDSWLLLALVVVLGWSIAAALQNSNWVSGSERLPGAVLVAIGAGWLAAISRLSRRGFVLVGLLVVAGYAVLSTLDAVHLGANFDVGPVPQVLRPLALWSSATWFQSRFALLIGLLALVMLAGLWTSWWVFRRRAGLVALLPTGTMLAVEVLNDTSPALIFFSLAWLASAVLLLVRLHYVRLKERWHARRIPRAADTTWTFGEIGFEATALLLLAAFLMPPLTGDDISSQLVPSTLSASGFHPFNFGNVFHGPLDIGYSETVRPGAQLRAKSIPIMSVSGEFQSMYPFWRGVALGGWDGEEWYLLNLSSELPVGRQESLAPSVAVPREDFPADTHRLRYLHNTFHVLTAAAAAPPTAFSAGEVIWVSKHPISVQGIVNLPGEVVTQGLLTRPLQVNTVGGLAASFDTVDQVHLADNPRPPLDYTVYSATPEVDEQTLRQASTDYPSWITPYRSLYYQNRIWNGGDTGRDADIAKLALTIVRNAHAQNPYDQARAIESWLRDKGGFTYTLLPKAAPEGVRQLDYFLFTSHSGYCQDFATAMAVMLRSLPDHVPVRVVSGYAIGSYEAKSQRYIVRATDAHTWVEVFFPGYGWEAFEPTKDGQNFPINRPATPADLNASNPAGEQVPGRVGAPVGGGPSESIGGGGGNGSRAFVDVGTRLGLGLILLLLLAILVAAVGIRWYLRPDDAPRIWRRLRFLGRELQVPVQPGDTPNEYGVKLARAVPPLAPEISTLARLFTRARYRRAGLDREDVAALHAAWDQVRRQYPRLLLRGIGRRLRNGPTGAAARGSGSRGPGRHRQAADRSRGGSR